MSSRVKITIVGDQSVGKTSFINVCFRESISSDYIPTVFDNYTNDVSFRNSTTRIAFFDTGGATEYSLLARLSYPNTDIFLICFDISNPNSLSNVVTRWYQDIRSNVNDPTIILVGLKKDLRNNRSIIQQLSELGQAPVSREEAMLKCREINAIDYFECSALLNEGINEVIISAIENSTIHPSEELHSSTKLGKLLLKMRKKLGPKFYFHKKTHFHNI